MNKTDFISALARQLSFLSAEERTEHLNFYAEMIDDRMEDGLSDEDAVAAVGSVDEIASQIVADMPLAKLAKERLKPKRHFGTWEIVLLVLGSPIWLSLVIAAAAVVFSVYVSLWSVIVSLWAVFAALTGSGLGCVIGGIIFACTGYIPSGIAAIGTGFVCAGLAIFMFFGCKAVTKGIVVLTGKIAVGIKKCFVKTEVA